MASSAVGNIFIGLQVDTRGARAFTSAANTVARDSDRMRSALGGTGRSVSALRATMSQNWRSRIFSDIIRQASQSNNEVAKLRATMLGLTALTGTSITGAFAATFILQSADSYTRLNNQLRTVTNSEENRIGVMQRLYRLSQDTRSDMQATITMYARISRAAETFGKTQEDIVRVTETVQKAFAIGGASQAEAQGAAIQLSQGIASDRFSGDEYRSVAENAPVLLQEMARNLDVTIGKLREMAHAGELTGKVVTDAILGASKKIDEDFGKTVSTVGQGLTRVGNAFLMYVGETDQSVGATRRLAEALANLAENFDEIAPWITGAAFAGAAIFGGRAAGGATAGMAANIMASAKASRENASALSASAAAELKTAQARLQNAAAAKAVAAANVTTAASVVRNTEADIASLRQTVALTQAQRAKAAAQTELNRGVAEATGRTGPYNAALAQQRASTTALVAAQQALRKAEASLIAGKAELAAKTTLAANAATGHAAALSTVAIQARAATAASAAMTRAAFLAGTAARSIGSGILGLLGGWTGAAFMAAIVGIGLYTANAAKAQERTSRLTRELHSLGLISDEVAGVVTDVADSIDDLGAAAARNKIREITDELERLKGSQNIFDQIFAYDPGMLGNIIQQLERVQAGFTADGRGVNTLSADQLAAAEELSDISVAARDGTATVDDLLARLEGLAKSSPGLPWLDTMIENLQRTIPYMDGLQTRAQQLEESLTRLNDAGISTAWIDNLSSQQESLAAVKEGADAVRAYADEQLRSLAMSEEEVGLEKIKVAIRKELSDAIEDGLVVQESALDLAAREILAAEAAKEAREEAAKAQDDFNKKVSDLSTEIDDATSKFEDMQAAATIKRLLDDFSTGTLKADTLKDRLAEINSVNLSDPMNTLIAKIIAAIGPLAQLLGLFNSFGGEGGSPLGGDLPGPASSRGALGRSRRELAAKQALGQGVLDTAIATAGLSERDAFIQDKTKELEEQAKALGGVATNAGETAAKLWEMDQAQKAADKSGKSATESAEKYAEGMAELSRELASAPLDPFLKEVLSSAESMGIATDELDAFVAAVTGGGIDAAPEKFRKIAAAMQEIKAINIMQDLKFEGQQMFRTDTEQSVYSTLRDSGIDVASAQGEMIAGQIRFNDRLKEARDISLGFAQDFRSALAEGKSFWEALGDAGQNALDKITSKALDMAVNGIFDLIFGAIGGGGFSSSITGSGGGYFPSLTGPSLPSFAGGGDTGNGSRSGGLDGMGGFLAMLHPQENVIDRTVASVSRGSSLSDIQSSSLVRIELSPDLEARILEQTASQSVQIVQAASSSIAEQGANGALSKLGSGEGDKSLSRFGVTPQAMRR